MERPAVIITGSVNYGLIGGSIGILGNDDKPLERGTRIRQLKLEKTVIRNRHSESKLLNLRKLNN